MTLSVLDSNQGEKSQTKEKTKIFFTFQRYTFLMYHFCDRIDPEEIVLVFSFILMNGIHYKKARLTLDNSLNHMITSYF